MKTIKLFKQLAVIVLLVAFSVNCICQERDYEAFISQIKKDASSGMRLFNDNYSYYYLDNLRQEMRDYFKANHVDGEEFYKYVLNKVLRDEISLSDFPSALMRTLLDAAKEYQYGGASFDQRFAPIRSAGYFKGNFGNIEVEIDGNIYTYNCAYGVSNDSDTEKVVMYSKKYSDIRNFNSAIFTEVLGRSYHPSQVYLTTIQINSKPVSMSSFFKDVKLDRAILFEPKEYIYSDKGSIMSYTITYEEKPDIIYTEPAYKVIAGQLVEMNSGINYIERGTESGFVSVMDRDNMQTSKTLALKDIPNPSFLKTRDRIYIYQSGIIGSKSHYNQSGISCRETPIFVTDYKLNIEYAFYPQKGDKIVGVNETPDYYLFYGTTTEEGYIGVDNPLLIVIDKTTHKVVKRYLKKEKDNLYRKIYVLNNNTILALRGEGSKDLDVIELSSIIPLEEQAESIKPKMHLFNNPDLANYSLDLYGWNKSALVGLTSKNNPNQTITDAVFNSIRWTNSTIAKGVLVAQKNNFLGLIDLSGKAITSFEFVNNLKGKELTDDQIMYGDCFYMEKNGKWGLIDSKGRIVVPFEYKRLIRDDELLKLNLVGVIKETIIPIEHKKGYGYVEKRFGLYDLSGNVIAPCEYCVPDIKNALVEGDFFLQKASGHGVIDKKGNIIVPFEYYGVEPFREYIDDERITLVHGFSTMGVITHTGRVLIPTGLYRAIEPYTDSKFIVTDSQRDYLGHGLYDASIGSFIIDTKRCSYMEPYFTSDGEAMLIVEDYSTHKWGIVSNTGAPVLDMAYDHLVIIDGECLLAEKRNRLSVISPSGKRIKNVKIEVDDIEDHTLYYIAEYKDDYLIGIVGVKKVLHEVHNANSYHYEDNTFYKGIKLSECTRTDKFSTSEPGVSIKVLL